MPIPWIDISLELPPDGATVYFRRIGLEYPNTGVWMDGPQQFLLPNGLFLNWEFVSKWRVL